MIQLRIQPQVSKKFPGIPIAMGILLDIVPRLDRDLFSNLESQLRIKYSLEQLRDHPMIRLYRDFFWRMGVDPTKHRPAAEALLRRLISKGALPRISPIVDACNLASVVSLLTYSAFDLDRLSPPLWLRFSNPGEELVLVGKRKITMGGEELVLEDSSGPICAYAHGDCERTKISSETRNVLIMVHGAPGITKDQIAQGLKLVADYLNSEYNWIQISTS